MNVLDALVAAGIVRVTESEHHVTITLTVAKDAASAVTLPVNQGSGRKGIHQRAALVAIERSGPLILDVIDDMAASVPLSVAAAPGARDTRPQCARRALTVLHERGLIVLTGDYVKLA